jgi:hypothetical protein
VTTFYWVQEEEQRRRMEMEQFRLEKEALR